MTTEEKSLEGQLDQLIGAGKSPALRSALMMLSLIKPEELREAVSRINHAETIGPMLQPTAWLAPGAFNNTRNWKDLLTKLADVCELLQPTDGDPGPDDPRAE